MQSSQVSLTGIALNLKSITEQGLVLNKGEVVSGLVQEIKPDGMLALLIKGKLVEAFSEVNVSQGQQVFLAVDDFREGRTYLKLLTPEALGQQRETGLALNLQKLGIESGEPNLAIAKKLIQYSLPVTRENVMEANQAVKVLGGSNPYNIELAVLSRAAGLPMNDLTLTALSAFLKEPSDIGRLVNNLVQLLGKMPDTAPTVSPNPGTSNKVEPQSTIPIKPDVTWAEPSTTPATIKLASGQTAPIERPVSQPAGQQVGNIAVVQNPPIPEEMEESLPILNRTAIEAEMKGALSTLHHSLTESEVVSTPATSQPPAGGDIWTQTRNIVRSLLTNLILRFNDEPEYNAQKMEARPRATTDLVKDLNALQTVLQKVELNTRPEVQQILSSLNRLEKEISGQQIFNSFNQTTGLNDYSTGVYYISFPVQLEQGIKQVQIKVQPDAPDRRSLRQADNLSLVVALDTNNLGKVLFHADWARAGWLGIKGIVEDALVGQYLDGNLESLIEALTGLGYQVENRGISVAQDVNRQADLHPFIEETKEELNLLAIDIIV